MNLVDGASMHIMSAHRAPRRALLLSFSFVRLTICAVRPLFGSLVRSNLTLYNNNWSPAPLDRASSNR